MIELIHSTSKEGEETQAAVPITADLLLDNERKQRKRFSSRGDRVCVGNEEVDGRVFGDVGAGVKKGTQGGEVNEGEGLRGVERGVVLGLSARFGAGSEEGDLGRGISLHLLCSVLLTHGKSSIPTSSKSSDPYPHHPPPPKAIVIDTSGSFPISLLASILKARLAQKIRDDNVGGTCLNGKQWSVEEVEEEVNRLLEMVAISRIFDIEGLLEVLGEVGTQKSNNEKMDITDIDEEGQESNQEKEAVELEIGDSEEEEDIDFSTSKTDKSPRQAHQSTTITHYEDGEDDVGTEIIIIDNLRTLISSLFSQKEKSAAHTLLTTLSRTLHTQTHSLNILTILHNTVTSTMSSTSYPQNPHQNPRQPQPSIPAPSLFPSTKLKPSFGRIFDQFVDLHVMISKVPATKEDAEMLYCGIGEEFGDGDGSTGGGEERGIRWRFVVEVLKDECSDLGSVKSGFAWREGRWGVLDGEELFGG